MLIINEKYITWKIMDEGDVVDMTAEEFSTLSKMIEEIANKLKKS